MKRLVVLAVLCALAVAIGGIGVAVYSEASAPRGTSDPPSAVWPTVAIAGVRLSDNMTIISFFNNVNGTAPTLVIVNTSTPYPGSFNLYVNWTFSITNSIVVSSPIYTRAIGPVYTADPVNDSLIIYSISALGAFGLAIVIYP